MFYTDILAYFQTYADRTKNFSLCLGTPLPDGTPTIYIHPADIDGDTVNLAVVPGTLTLSLDPLTQNDDGTFTVNTIVVPSGE